MQTCRMSAVTIIALLAAILAAAAVAVTASDAGKGLVTRAMKPGTVLADAPGQLLIGPGPPRSEQGKAGDSFIDSSQRALYKKISDNAWTETKSLRETPPGAWFTGSAAPEPRLPSEARPGDHWIYDRKVWVMRPSYAWAEQGSLASGQPGPDGHKWYFAAGLPSNYTFPSPPSVGSRYQDTQTKHLYVLEPSGWLEFSKNAPGEKGATVSWYSGPGTPADNSTALASAVDGDLFTNTSNGDVYALRSGAWVQSASLTGKQGAKGPDGHRWFHGSGAPSSGNTDPYPQAGDMYMDAADHRVYTYTGAGWTSTTRAGGSGRSCTQTVSFEATKPSNPVQGDIHFGPLQTGTDKAQATVESKPISVWDNGAWRELADLQGERGEAGPIEEPTDAALQSVPGPDNILSFDDSNTSFGLAKTGSGFSTGAKFVSAGTFHSLPAARYGMLPLEDMLSQDPANEANLEPLKTVTRNTVDVPKDAMALVGAAGLGVNWTRMLGGGWGQKHVKVTSNEAPISLSDLREIDTCIVELSPSVMEQDEPSVMFSIAWTSADFGFDSGHCLRHAFRFAPVAIESDTWSPRTLEVTLNFTGAKVPSLASDAKSFSFATSETFDVAVPVLYKGTMTHVSDPQAQVQGFELYVNPDLATYATFSLPSTSLVFDVADSSVLFWPESVVKPLHDKAEGGWANVFVTVLKNRAIYS